MERDELLIEAVKSYPCIYNSIDPDFKVQLRKENAWSAIADALGRTGTQHKYFHVGCVVSSIYNTSRRLPEEMENTQGKVCQGIEKEKDQKWGWSYYFMCTMGPNGPHGVPSRLCQAQKASLCGIK